MTSVQTEWAQLVQKKTLSKETINGKQGLITSASFIIVAGMAIFEVACYCFMFLTFGVLVQCGERVSGWGGEWGVV